ncbi:hypothetical protein MtrunA17_Chr2g0304491 [Medicago truncatula]|uniref:Transmembrane protein n=1 Tax=Medicago truncatula TaxID=3880 RepID=A0A396JCD9_MEDTR|nr:hypothetical protein MtrunA17_Chr2g0304491 [Medicago truncatula]
MVCCARVMFYDGLVMICLWLVLVTDVIALTVFGMAVRNVVSVCLAVECFSCWAPPFLGCICVCIYRA